MGCAKSKAKDKIQTKIQTKIRPKMEAKLKLVGPQVQIAGVYVAEAEGKVKLVSDLVYRAYAMALQYSMGEVQKGLDQLKKCIDLLNKVLNKNYVYADTTEMDEKLQEGLDDLVYFLENKCLVLILQAIIKLGSVKVPPAKHVQKKLIMAKENVEKPIKLIGFMKKFFHVSFKVYRILGEDQPDKLEQSKAEFAKVFEEFKNIHSSFFPPSQKVQIMTEKVEKKKNQLRIFRLKIQRVYHGVELMARRLRDSGTKLVSMGEAMQISLPQLVKALFGSIVRNMEGSSDMNILLDNSVFYLENSIMKVLENLSSSNFEQVLDITEHTFEEKVVDDVEEIIGWVFPSMYKEFKDNDMERFRKILKVQQWYDRINGLLGNTHNLLEHSVDQFQNLSKHLGKGNRLAEVCKKLKICQTKTEEVIENMETSSPVIQVLPKLCRYILSGAELSSIMKLRKEALEEMKNVEIAKKQEKKVKESEEKKKKKKKDKTMEEDKNEPKLETEEDMKKHLIGSVVKLSKSFTALTTTYKETAVEVVEVLIEIDAKEKEADKKLEESQVKEAKKKIKEDKKQMKKGEQDGEEVDDRETDNRI